MKVGGLLDDTTELVLLESVRSYLEQLVFFFFFNMENKQIVKFEDKYFPDSNAPYKAKCNA